MGDFFEVVHRGIIKFCSEGDMSIHAFNNGRPVQASRVGTFTGWVTRVLLAGDVALVTALPCACRFCVLFD
jgi:hypothetical protein